MKTAYRIPDNECACVEPGTRPQTTRPISKMNIRSFLTSHVSGDRVRPGVTELRGIAFDGGSGVARVLVSGDGGTNWQPALLGENLGGYSFREWRVGLSLPRGTSEILVRAEAGDGTTQPFEQRWQPSGYMRNIVERTSLEVL